MKQSDIPAEQQARATELLVAAALRLRDEGVGKFWDDGHAAALIETLSFGRYWRSAARIHSEDDARRELLALAEKWEAKRRG